MIRGRLISFLSAAALIAVAASSCRHEEPEGPNTSYPCGVWGVACGNGACCPWAHVCGVEGDPWRRCEVGYCCASGDPFYGAGPDAGGHPTLKQRTP